MTRNTVDVVLPNDIDDPARPSGGNTYDRRICEGLRALGWTVREHAVSGGWPHPGGADSRRVGGLLAALPDDAVVLLDGLVGSAVPEALLPHAQRLRLIVLVHMPLGNDVEGAALASADAIVATSVWTRRRLLDLYPLPADRVHVATPGVDPAPLARGSASDGNLLCVAAVRPHKGHDRLAAALAQVTDLPWSCLCVGPLGPDTAYLQLLRRRIQAFGLADRMRLVGPRTGRELDAAYAAADLLVLASRSETYGMVVAEALARGVPAVLTAAAGLPESLGRAADGTVPGLLVPPDDPAALAAALRRWLTDPGLRRELRRAARGRRATLRGWAVTARAVSAALHDTARELRR